MAINPVSVKVENNSNSTNLQNCKVNGLPQVRNTANLSCGKDSVSFGSAKTGLVSVMDFIERKGFFCDFLVVDALSMILPRVTIGLLRDRDKTGKINYKAGAEEAGREVISGPSMMLIPIGAMQIYKHFAPATHMNRDTLKALTNNMGKIIEANDKPEMLVNKEQLNGKLANKLFDEAFSDFELDNKEQLKSKFSELLNNSTKLNKKFFGKNKEFNNAAAEFEKHIVEINNKNKIKPPTDSKIIKLNEDAKVQAKGLFEDFHNYSRDVVHKLTQKSFTKGVDAKTFLEKIQVNRSITKFAAATTAFLAVGAFLLHLPKIYQVSKTSPAMESAKRAQKEAAQGGANNEN